MIITLGGRSLKVEVGRVIKHDPDVRGLVAAMARSEVKNYLADIAEQAGLPFDKPDAFLSSVNVMAKQAAAHQANARNARGQFTKKGM